MYWEVSLPPTAGNRLFPAHVSSGYCQPAAFQPVEVHPMHVQDLKGPVIRISKTALSPFSSAFCPWILASFVSTNANLSLHLSRITNLPTMFWKRSPGSQPRQSWGEPHFLVSGITVLHWLLSNVWENCIIHCIWFSSCLWWEHVGGLSGGPHDSHLLVLMPLHGLLPLSVDRVCDFLPTSRIWKRWQGVYDYMFMTGLHKVVMLISRGNPDGSGRTSCMLWVASCDLPVAEGHVSRSWAWPLAKSQPEMEALKPVAWTDLDFSKTHVSLEVDLSPIKFR